MKKQLFISIIMVSIFVAFVACEKDENIDTKPVSAFTVERAKITLGEALLFTNASFDENGSIANWEWDFGDGETSSEENPSHQYKAIGEYTVKLVVKDNTGNKNANDFSKQILVVEPSFADVEPNISWRFQVPYYSYEVAPAVHDDGTVILATDGKSGSSDRGDYNMMAVKNGSVIWGFLTDEVVRSTPAIADNGTSYFSDYKGVMVAVNADGSEKWKKDFGKQIKYSGAVTASDGTIYVGMENDNCLLAINPADGSEKWRFKVGNDVRTTPAVGKDGIIYFGSSDKFFYAVNADGTEKWKAEYGGYSSTAVAIGTDGTVLFACKAASGKGELIAYDPANGNIKWSKTRAERCERGGVSVAPDGTIYWGAEDNMLKAYSPEGEELWTFNANAKIISVPAIDNEGAIYFGDTDGNFYILNKKGKNKYKTVKLGEEINASPAIGNDGTIYVLARNNSTKKGELVALKTTATGLANGGWAMRSRNAKHSGRDR